MAIVVSSLELWKTKWNMKSLSYEFFMSRILGLKKLTGRSPTKKQKSLTNCIGMCTNKASLPSRSFRFVLLQSDIGSNPIFDDGASPSNDTEGWKHVRPNFLASNLIAPCTTSGFAFHISIAVTRKGLSGIGYSRERIAKSLWHLSKKVVVVQLENFQLLQGFQRLWDWAKEVIRMYPYALQTWKISQNFNGSSHFVV